MYPRGYLARYTSHPTLRSTSPRGTPFVRCFGVIIRGSDQQLSVAAVIVQRLKASAAVLVVLVGIDVPSGDVPSGDVPSGDVPSGDVPSGDVPSGDVPSAVV